jgi:hypothetical protein
MPAWAAGEVDSIMRAMRLAKDFPFTALGWTFGVSVAPGWLSIGASWEVAPASFALALPLVHLSIERIESDWCSGASWRWGWTLARLTVRKTEFRLDLDLNDWRIGLACVEFDDFSVHLGPFNVQIEAKKFFADDFPPGVPTLRLLFPRGQSVRPWPPRCRCCLPCDCAKCDDVTDFADDPP